MTPFSPNATAVPPEPRPRYGLAIARDMLIAPNAAFAKVAASRGWIATYVAILAAVAVVTFLYAPALAHFTAITPPPPGQPVPKTPAEIAAANQRVLANFAVQQILMTLSTVLLTASALTTVARFKGQMQPYTLFFSLATNCTVPSIVGSVIGAIVVRAHDAASFHNLHALAVALPTNLAVFANPADDREVTFLSRFDLFNVWSDILLALGFVRLVSVKFTTALIVAFGLDLLFAMIF